MCEYAIQCIHVNLYSLARKSPKKTAPSEPTLVTSSKASPVKGAKNQPKKPHKSPHKSPHTSPHKAASKSPRKWGALNFSMVRLPLCVVEYYTDNTCTAASPCIAKDLP